MKNLEDYSNDEVKHWQEHPITRATAEKVGKLATDHAMQVIRSAGNMTDAEVKENAGYNRGLRDAIRMLGGVP